MPTGINFTSGIPHTDGAPTHNPGATGGKVAYDYAAEVLYKHVSGTTWVVLPLGAGGSATVEYPAGQNLSSGRVVIIDSGDAFYFQPLNATHMGRAYAITTTSATTGNDVTLQLIGEVNDMAFGFSPDTILWVADDGEVVNTQPTGKLVIQKAGIASGANKMRIDFSTAIKLI